MKNESANSRSEKIDFDTHFRALYAYSMITKIVESGKNVLQLADLRVIALKINIY